jgi:hypothetical protein
MELNLTQLFGEGATQTATNLLIQKSSLRGLTPLSNNHSEQMLAAIILTASHNFIGVLEDDLERLVTDNFGNSIDFDNSILYEDFSIEEWKRVIIQSKIKHTFLVHQSQPYVPD